MKVDLAEHKNLNRNDWSVETHGRSIPLKSSVPFIKANRGVLTHRVKHGAFHKSLHGMSHASICYCGLPLFPHKSTLMDAPQPDQIVCRRCEAAAINDGRPSSSEMAGYHIHVGGVKAFADCCDVVITDADHDDQTDTRGHDHG